MTPIAIRALRRRLGLSQEGFARRLGVSFATVNRWENGRTAPWGIARHALRRLDSTTTQTDNPTGG